MGNPRLTLASASALLFLFACSDGRGLSAGPDASTGGAITGNGGAVPGTGGDSTTGTGGAVATGGRMGTGGADATGGRMGTGGSVVTGGRMGTGGAVASGGRIATGGAITGTGGKAGGAGGSGIDGGKIIDAGRDVVCPPVCDVYCPYGNEVDSNGCELCKCKPAPADAGTKKDVGPIVCPPVCAIYCPNGNVLDENGCPTCTCKPAPVDAKVCPIIACPAIGCPYGYALDRDGCPTCKCNPNPAECPAIKCVACPFGYLKDANGCDTCTCAPDPGTTPCADLTSEAWCTMASTRCRWLVRGCTEPALPATGCYDQTRIDCTSTCPSGTTCLGRSINPCYNLNCASCARLINICL